MSLFQTLVLLMFNEGEEFSLEEIKLATGIGMCKYRIIFNMSLIKGWWSGKSCHMSHSKTSQQEGPRFGALIDSECLSVQGLRAFSVPALVSSWFSGFLPQFEGNVQIKSTGYSNLPIGVNVSVAGFSLRR